MFYLLTHFVLYARVHKNDGVFFRNFFSRYVDVGFHRIYEHAASSGRAKKKNRSKSKSVQRRDFWKPVIFFRYYHGVFVASCCAGLMGSTNGATANRHISTNRDR